VPVLAVAPHHAGPIRRAVVGVDFSAASIRAALTALALLEPNPEHLAGGAAAPDGSGRLTLVHARSVLETIPPGLATWTADYDASVALRFTRLLDLLRPVVPDGVTIETRIGVGEIVKCVEEIATAEGADLVAVGTHGPDWVERLFVGSIATSTLRHARRTVLVAPAPSPAERVRLELAVSGQVLLDRPGDWAGALDAFTRRNLGRRVRLEVSGPELEGFVVEAERYRFRGACYDAHDRRVEIMLGDDADRTRHLTHALGHVRSVEIVSERERRDRMLLVEFDDGSAVLTFTG
jgi:nucleotide-binding universal stress UspA family protein